MYRDKASVLIVTSSKAAEDYFKKILGSGKFSPVAIASNAGEAKRMQLENNYDIVVINAPLSDEFGTELSLELSENSGCGVLLFVKNELYEHVSYKVCDYGVITLSKPSSNHLIYQALLMLLAMRQRVAALEKKAVTLEAKMKEIRLVNRAKCLLIERFKMSEEQAHKYIEKSAMDNCVKKTEIAQNIIQTYGDNL